MNDRIVLFDGVCNFCEASVLFIIERDRKGLFSFAPLQSNLGRSYLEQHDIDSASTDSIVLIKHDKAYVKSDAALEIAKELDGIWKCVYVLRFIPAPMRDAVYSLVAKNRYRWFGVKQQCLNPSHGLQNRMLDDVKHQRP